MSYSQTVRVFLFILTIHFVSMSPAAFAGPAYTGYIDYPLANGNTIKLALKGDEHLSWYESINQNIYIAVKTRLHFAEINSNGQLVASAYPIDINPPNDFKVLNRQDPQVMQAIEWEYRNGKKAHSKSSPTQFNSAVSNSSYASTVMTDVPLLTVLMSFNDVQIIGSGEYWHGLIHDTTAEFFELASRGQFRFQQAVESEGVSNDGLIHVSLDMNHPNPFRASDQSALSAAIEAIDPFINFAQYDKNADGILSTSELNIFFVYAGWEGSISGQFSGPSVWGHVSRLPSAYRPDGMTLQMSYARVGERHRDRLSTMGIVAHELGHLTFGWPDLYDISPQFGGSNALGRWGLMASGSWNAKLGEFSGATPAFPNPILRHWQGWETQSMTVGTHQLAELSAGGESIKIETSDDHHYSLIEVRGTTGFDDPLNLRAPSLLVWKYRSGGSNSTRENYDGSVRFPYIELAANQAGTEGSPSYLLSPAETGWPTNAGVDYIGTISNPSLHVRDANEVDTQYLQAWDLENITRLSDGQIEFSSTKVDNFAPLVRLEIPESIYRDSTLTLDASASRDQDGSIAEYRWQGPWGSATTNSPYFDHTFSDLGETMITLSIRDNEGRTASEQFTINVVETTTPPVAVITGLTSSTINLADNITFQAFDSYDPKPDGGISRYRWIGPWGDTAGAPYFQHRFMSAGEYSVTLEVTDRAGLSDETSLVITVIDDGINLPPTAVLGDDQTKMIGDAIYFDARDSFDEDGIVTSYYWEGPWGTRTGRAFYHFFYDVGVFPVTLTVTDNEGASHSVTQVITVEPRPLSSNYDDVYLRGTFNNWSGTRMDLVANNTWELTVEFGASNQARFKFDIFNDWSLNFGDNGADGTMEQTGADIFIGQGEGTYTIQFNDSAMRYTVHKRPANQAPQADAGPDLVVNVGDPVQLDGSGSTDPDGTIVEYSWSIGLTGASVITNYNVAGIYEVVLTVTDNDGATATDTVTVSVIDPDQPLLSTYESMFVRGTFNTWGAQSMNLVEDYIWELELSLDSDDELKFDVSADWSTNFGDNDANGYADSNGANIHAPASLGLHRVRFNDQTKQYQIISVE